MDLGVSRDMFDSFIRYQNMIQAEFQRMQQEFGFEIVDGNRQINGIQRELREKIGSQLGISSKAARTTKKR